MAVFLAAEKPSTSIGYLSLDGVTWSEMPLDSNSANYWVVDGNLTKNVFIRYAKADAATDIEISTNLLDWTNRNPGIIVRAAALGGGYIMATDGSAVRRSLDGVTWSTMGSLPVSIGTTPNMAYANGVWLITSSASSTTYYSTNDGTSWTSKSGPSGIGASNVNSLFSNGKIFIRTANANGALYTWDGVPANNWQAQFAQDTVQAFGCGRSVTGGPIAAVKTNGTGVFISYDNAATWSYAELSFEGADYITYDNKFGFLVAGYEPLGTTTPARKSLDGVTWTAITLPVNQILTIFGVEAIVTIPVVGSTEQLSVASNIKQSTRIRKATSTSIASRIRSALKPITSIATVTADAFVETWRYSNVIAMATATTTAIKQFTVELNKNITVLINTNSSLGKIWTKPWSIIYAAAKWVGVKKNTNIAATSTDGAAWTSRTLPANQNWGAIAHNGTVYAAVAINSAVAATSTDGVTWTSRSLPTSRLWTALASGGGKFVAVAANSDKAATSNDGITWAEYDIPQGNWVGIAHNGTVFSAITGSKTCATSTDGITWVEQSMPDNINYTSITWALNQFTAVASGPTDKAAKSADGVTWSAITMPTVANWSAVGPGVGTPNV